VRERISRLCFRASVEVIGPARVVTGHVTRYGKTSEKRKQGRRQSIVLGCYSLFKAGST
jgi:hypothetical protein